MNLFTALSLAGAVFLLAITPGPGLFAIIAKALSAGFIRASLVVLGIVVGDIIFLLFSIYGLVLIAENMYFIFLIMKYLGALYLICLGIKTYTTNPSQIPITIKHQSIASDITLGLFVTLSNPKAILFYLVFLPTFIDITSVSYAEVVQIVTVVASVLYFSLLAYAYLAHKSRHLFQSHKSQTLINKISGGMLISIGATLAIKE